MNPDTDHAPTPLGSAQRGPSAPAQDETDRAAHKIPDQWRLIAAVVVPLLACAAQWTLWDFIQPFACFLFFPSVFFCAYIGGLRGALLSTVISVLLVWYIFIPPQFSFEVQNPHSIWSVIMFMAMGALFGAVHERITRAKRQSDEALALARKRTQEAEDANARRLEESAARLRVEKDAKQKAAELAERNAYEREIERLTRLYATLSQINQCVVRVQSEEELAWEVSRVAIEFGGFKLAWVGRHDPQTGDITPLGSAGEPREFVHNFRHSSKDNEQHHCLCGPAIRENRPNIANDLSAVVEMRDWPSVMEPAIVRAAAVFPVRAQGKVWGIFGVYASEKHVFQDKEAALLEEAALNIGFALEHLAHEEQRQQAEAKVRENHARLKKVLEVETVGVMFWDLSSGCLVDANDTFLNLMGYSRRDIEAREVTWQKLTPPEYVEVSLAEVEKFRTTGRVGPYEKEYLCRDGTRHWFVFAGSSLGEDSCVEFCVDISDRKKAEAALRANERLLRDVIDLVPHHIFAKDRDGRYLFINRAAAESVGRHPRELVGRLELEFSCNKQHTEAFLKDDREVIDSGRPKFIPEEPITYADGRVHFLQTTKLPFTPPGSVKPGILGVAVDVSDQKKAEEALRLAHARLQQFVDANIVGIVVAQADGAIVEANDYYLNLIGYTREEFNQGKVDWRAITPPEWLPADEKAVAELRERGTCEPYEKEYIRRDGTRVQVLLVDALLPGAEEQIAAFVLDITDRKRAEEALRESELQFRTLADSGQAMVWTSGLDKKCNYFNQPWLKFTGRPVEQELGDGWTAGVHSDDLARCIEVYTTAFDRRARFSMDYRLRRHDGEYRWIQDDGTPRYDSQGNFLGYIGHCLDVTERKRAEEAIQRLNAELEQRVHDRTAQLEAANKEMEAFSYSVSHDLRAPLRAINGYASMLTEDHAQQIGEDGRRLLGVVSSEAERMGQLIDDLLQFSRVGRKAMERQAVDMTAMAQRAFDECVAQAPGRDIRLKLHPLPSAMADAALLPHVWGNLLSNAVKYTREKPVAEIEITGKLQGDELIYCVKDNGAGFDMQYAHRLFGVFQRLHSEAEFEGTGVGLALVQRIVLRHGGSVWAEATLGEGAAFYFTLPAGKT